MTIKIFRNATYSTSKEAQVKYDWLPSRKYIYSIMFWTVIVIFTLILKYLKMDDLRYMKYVESKNASILPELKTYFSKYSALK